MAKRLSWVRLLSMALDAAKGAKNMAMWQWEQGEGRKGSTC